MFGRLACQNAEMTTGICLNTVKLVLKDYCPEIPPVLKDQLFLAAEVTQFYIMEPVTKDHLP